MDIRALLLGTAFAAMWSSAFATARVIVAHAPPLGSLSLRFLISGLIAVVIAWLLGQTWRLAPRQAWAVILLGLCQNALYLGLNFVAGLAAGFAGVGLIMGTRLSGGADPFGIALCVGGAVALAVATLTIRGAATGGNLLMVVGLQMLVGSVVLGAISAMFETISVTVSPAFLAAFAYQIFVPGLTATLIWFALVGRIGSTRASTFHFLNPFFGIAIAAVLLGERIRPLDILGVAVAMAGILAVQMARSRPGVAAATPD